MWPTYQITFILVLIYANGAFTLSDKRLCGDPECKEIISFGKAKIKYNADEKGKVSFNINSKIRIKSKSAGSDKSFWGIEVNGRSGYAPKDYILEEKILIKDKDLVYEVDVENFEEDAKKPVDEATIKLKPSEAVEEKVKPTEIPLTDPLNKVMDNTPSLLNVSESETEATTTAPLVEENVKIVDKTILEVITPVLSDFEVIDGTAIPVTESVTKGDSKEDVITKIDTTLGDTPAKNEQTSNEAIPNDKPSNINNETAANLVQTIIKEAENNGSVARTEDDLKVSINSTPQNKPGDNEKDIKAILENGVMQEEIKTDSVQKSLNIGKEIEEVKEVISVDASDNEIGNGKTVSETTPSAATTNNAPIVSNDNTTTAATPAEITVTAETASNDTPNNDVSNVSTEEATTAATPVEIPITEAKNTANESSNNDTSNVSTEEATTAATPVEIPINEAKNTANESSNSDASNVSTEEATTAATPVEIPITEAKNTANESSNNDASNVSTEEAKTSATPVEIPINEAKNTANESSNNDASNVSTEEATTAATPVEIPINEAKNTANESSNNDASNVSTEEATTAATPVEIPINEAKNTANKSSNNDASNVSTEEATTAATPVEIPNNEAKNTPNDSSNNVKTINAATPAKNPITQPKNTLNDASITNATITKTENSPTKTNTFEERAEKPLESENTNVLVKEASASIATTERSSYKSESLEEAKDTKRQETLVNETDSVSTRDDDDDDANKNNDDDEHDETKNDVEDDEMKDINISSASVKSYTTISPQDFTDSGYDANQNKINWQEDEEVVTKNPQLIVDSTTAKIPTNAENVESIIPATPTDTYNTYNVESNTIKENEETIKAQVPPLPTMLPLFQKPSLINEENPNAERIIASDNKNELNFKETEIKTEETLPKKQSIDSSDRSTQKYVPEKEKNIEANIEMIAQQTESPGTYIPREEKREDGLFSTILGTVNTFVNKLSKEPTKTENDVDEKLQNILFPDHIGSRKDNQEAEEYCEKLSPNQCPQAKHSKQGIQSSFENQQCHFDWSHINMDNFHEILLARAFEMRDLLSCLAITASASLLFLFGYYCFCNTSREGGLISKLNQLERSLLATQKENLILKDDLLKTRSKLTSIEDNSFGSNDMVMALKKELEIITAEKNQLQQHVNSLEKELETAAEAGLELNKIVAELLNNQSGHESMIMNSVEDLQTQFNEQQKTIFEINANLAEKSRENSELQLMLAEQSVRFNGEIASLQQDNDELEAEKANLQTRIEDLKAEFEEDITKALEGKNVEIKRLHNEIKEVKNRFEDIHCKWQTSLAKIEALEDCMKTMKRAPGININEYIDAANVKAELLDLQKQRSTLKSQLETEKEAHQHAESSLKNTISEVDKLKQEFHQSEKDKLEAQTRLEVLSNYFKEKETQLQKELSLKEAIWLKQQGENTSTVDRMTAMQEEIQSLKSQNDALRAEIEAQLAAHKAQTGTLENRAHETWLAARQSERRFEEARAEAAALRRRLTELSGAANPASGVDSKMAMTATEHNAPSPILPPPLMDTASSPLLGRLPPPPFMPFMGPPPPPPSSFLNLPPPPFLTPVEMRPAPLGRMMSPPASSASAAQRDRNRSNYYDDDYDDSDEDDDDDYGREEYDYDYEDDEDVSRHRHRPRRRRRSGNGSDRSYTPPPPERSYRSQSPTDSRYNDTDHSPPTSPYARGGVSGHGTDNYAHSMQTPGAAVKESTYVKKSSKGVTNSDSDKSYNSTHHKKKGKSMV